MNNLWFLYLKGLINLASIIVFAIVMIPAILAVVACFWPYHPMVLNRIPEIDKFTLPVFSFFRRVCHSSLEIEFHEGAQSLDIAPFILLLLVYPINRLVIFLLMLMFE